MDISTIKEWWEFAKRRRWLEPVGSRWGLTEKAEKDLQTERDRVNNPDPKRLAGSVAHLVIPTSLIGFAGLASGRYLQLDAAIFAMAAIIILSLLVVAGLSRAVDPPMDRWLALRACDWLEGRSIWPARGTNYDQADFSRLYHLADERD
jgi:hypothetical protein